MVNIVTLANSPVFLIQAALTANSFKSSNQRYRVNFISPNDVSIFWLNVYKYCDEGDKSLVILGIKAPDDEVIKKIKPNKGEYLISYSPDAYSPLTIEKEDSLRDKGIFVLPVKEPYESYLGEVEGDAARWLDYAKVLSFEEQDKSIKFDKKILNGLVKTCLKNPQEAVKLIIENDWNTFGQRAVIQNKKTKIRTIDNSANVILNTKAQDDYLLPLAVDTALKRRHQPVGVIGRRKWLVTESPSFTKRMLGKKLAQYSTIHLGKGAAFGFRQGVSEPDVLVSMGKIMPSRIIIEVESDPRSRSLASSKRLKRRILGEKTRQKVRGRSYVKKYHSIRDNYPEIVMRGNLIIASPRSSEQIIRVLKTDGIRFRIIESTQNSANQFRLK